MNVQIGILDPTDVPRCDALRELLDSRPGPARVLVAGGGPELYARAKLDPAWLVVALEPDLYDVFPKFKYQGWSVLPHGAVVYVVYWAPSFKKKNGKR